MVFRVGVIGVGGHVFNHQSCYVCECTVRMIPLHILLISDRKRYVESTITTITGYNAALLFLQLVI
jgi:hypothetical protein